MFIFIFYCSDSIIVYTYHNYIYNTIYTTLNIQYSVEYVAVCMDLQ